MRIFFFKISFLGGLFFTLYGQVKTDTVEAAFDFENTSRLNYTPIEEEIIYQLNNIKTIQPFYDPFDSIEAVLDRINASTADSINNEGEIAQERGKIVTTFPLLFIRERDPEGRSKPLRGFTWTVRSAGCTQQNPSFLPLTDTVFTRIVGEKLPQYEKTLTQKVNISDEPVDNRTHETEPGTNAILIDSLNSPKKLYFAGMQARPSVGQLKPGFGPIEKKITNRERHPETKVVQDTLTGENIPGYKKPLTQKINLGNEVVCTFLFGTEFYREKYLNDSLVKAFTKIKTKGPLVYNVTSEYARLIPGYNKAVTKKTAEQSGVEDAFRRFLIACFVD